MRVLNKQKSKDRQQSEPKKIRRMYQQIQINDFYLLCVFQIQVNIETISQCSET